MKELQQDQEQVKDPPGRVGSHNLPALEQGGVQNPSDRESEGEKERQGETGAGWQCCVSLGRKTVFRKP